MQQFSKLLDLKSVGRIPSFSGKPADWDDFKFRFLLSMSFIELDSLLELVATSTTETEVHQLDLEHSEKSKILYGILCQCCENRALSLLKLAARSCGLEGWRLLLLEYEPRASVRIAQMLSGILQPKFSNSLNQFQLELTQWKIQVSKYEGIASGEGGKHILDDTVKIATVLGHAPPVIRQFLATQPQDFTKFEDLERSLIGFIGRQTTYDQNGLWHVSTPNVFARVNERNNDDMEVDALYQQKGKGKGKGKGKFGSPGGSGKGFGKFGNKGKGKFNNWNNQYKGKGSHGYNDNKGKGKGKGSYNSYNGYSSYGGYNDQQWNGWQPKGSYGYHSGKNKGKGKFKGKGKGKFVHQIGQEEWSNEWSEEGNDQWQEEPWNEWNEQSQSWNNEQDWQQSEEWQDHDQWNEQSDWQTEQQQEHAQTEDDASASQSLEVQNIVRAPRPFVFEVSSYTQAASHVAAVQVSDVASDTSVASVSNSELLLDSGSYIHVCPWWFAQDVPMIQAPKIDAITASGKPLKHYGDKVIHLRTKSQNSISCRFHVMNVSRPILSVGRLAQQGHVVKFTPDGAEILYNDGQTRDDLTRRGEVYFLQVAVDSTAVTAVQQQPQESPNAELYGLQGPSLLSTGPSGRQGNSQQELQQQQQQQHQQQEHALWEYPCSSESNMTRCFQSHGQKAFRVTKETHDVRRRDTAERVLRHMQEVHRSNPCTTMWLWIALPCTAWCAWHHVNLSTGDERTAALVAQTRRESLQMLHVLAWLLAALTMKVNLVFEWPATSTGWHLPVVKQLMARYMPYQIRLDGCEYGVKSHTGMALKKPWRIQTSVEPLSQNKAIRRTCQGNHPHAQTRGRDATQSGNYPRLFCEKFYRAMVQSEQQQQNHTVSALHDSEWDESQFEFNDSSGAPTEPQERERFFGELFGDEEMPTEAPTEYDLFGTDEEADPSEETRIVPYRPQEGAASGQAVPVGDFVANERQPERAPQPYRLPKAPSKTEVQNHELTHLPFQPWCRQCVESYARQNAHTQRSHESRSSDPTEPEHEKAFELQLDYSFMKTSLAGDHMITILLIYCVQTQACFAQRVPRKGPGVPGLIPLILSWLGEHRMLNAKIDLRGDIEPALQALVDRMCREAQLRAAPQSAPPKSSQSIGGVSRLAGSIAGLTRTLIATFVQYMGFRVPTRHPLWSWAVRHCSWLMNRFAVRRASGLTAFEATHSRPYKGHISVFGLPCWGHLTGSTGTSHRADPRWVLGLWVGKDTLTDESILITEGGVMRTRSVKRVPYLDTVQKTDLWNKLVWTRQKSQLIPAGVPNLKGDDDSAPTQGARKPAKMPQEPEYIELQLESQKVETETQTEAPMLTESGTQATTATTTTSSGPSELQQRDAGTQAAPTMTDTASGSSKRPADALPQVPRAKPLIPRQVGTKRDRAETEEQQKEIEFEFGRGSVLKDTERQRQLHEELESDPSASSSNAPGSASVSMVLGGLGATQEGWLDLVSLISIDGPPYYDSTTGEELDVKKTEIGMAKEESSMQDMGTFDEVPESEVPEDATKIPSRWVLKAKEDEVKARIVAQQLATSQLADVFASTPSALGLRMLLWFCLSFGWKLITGDVSTAFLHAPIPEGVKIFIIPPPNVRRRRPGMLWRLRRALYGLRHSPKYWQDYLRYLLKRIGLTPCVADPSLYFMRCAKRGLIAVLSVHTDDLILTGDSTTTRQVTAAIAKVVKIKWQDYLSSATWTRYLGREYNYSESEKCIYIRIPVAYWEETLKMCGLMNGRVSPVPGTSAKASDDAQPLSAEHHTLYRGIVGRLMWTLGERPDLAYSVKELARNCAAPTTDSWKKLVSCIKYVKGTMNHVLKLQLNEVPDMNKITISIMTDADWSTKCSSGGLVALSGVVLLTFSRTQQAISLSSCESEFTAMTEGVKEGMLVLSLLREITPASQLKMDLATDSTSATALASRRGVSKLTKHISIKLLFVQDLVDKGDLSLSRVSSYDNTSDIFTKYLTTKTFERLRSQLGIVDASAWA